MASNWSSGLCDCFDDFPSCCMTCWCPCITFGRIAAVLDKGSPGSPGSPSCVSSGAIYALLLVLGGWQIQRCYSCFYRTKLRLLYFQQGRPDDDCSAEDCLIHCLCEYCALCQEYRELKSRGADMIIGTQGNVLRQNREAQLAPAAQEGMNRQ